MELLLPGNKHRFLPQPSEKAQRGETTSTSLRGTKWPTILFVYLLKTCHILKLVGGCFLWIPHASSDIETPYGLLELVKFATDIAGFVTRK